MAEPSSSTDAYQAPDSSFPLLDLPPELWVRIVELVVTEHDEIRVSPEDLPIAFKIPSIAQTCRTIRAEGLRHFYRNNTFMVGHSCISKGIGRFLDWMQDCKDKGTWKLTQPAKLHICCLDRRAVEVFVRGRFPRKAVEVLEVTTARGNKVLSVRMDDKEDGR